MPSSSFFRCRPLLLAAACLAATGAAQADYLWLSRDGANAAARIGELDKTPQPVTGVSAPRAFLADGKDLPLTTEADRVVIPAAAGADPRPRMRIRLCVRSLWDGDALALSARNGFFVRPGPSRLGVPPFFRGGTPSHPAPAGRERKRSVPPLPPRQP